MDAARQLGQFTVEALRILQKRRVTVLFMRAGRH